MSSSDPNGQADSEREAASDEQEKDSLANKLSKDLANWKRKRTSSRPHRPIENHQSSSRQSEPARTIKVRGHETLVVRKPRLAAKPPSNASQDSR